MEMSNSSSLLELPLHLLSMVLAQLDSIQSLGSAILSHPLFYDAFNEDTKRVVRSILRNQIPPELMCYAEATFKAQFVDNDDGKEVSRLLRSAFESFDYELDGVPFQHWRLEWIFDHPLRGNEASKASRRGKDNQSYRAMGAISIASTISRTYGHVEYFCECFIRDRLPLMQKLMGRRPNPEDRRPSQMELFRIRRALYRFQIYCNLYFRDVVDFHPGRWVREMRNYRLGRHFFSPFSPWVKEQLACVHDYLEEVLSRTFDDIAAHEVVWGALSVDWLAQGRRNEHKQAFVGPRHYTSIIQASTNRQLQLTYGLHFLFDLETRHEYQQRRRLLESKGLPRTPVALAAHLERDVPKYSNALGDRVSLIPIPVGSLTRHWPGDRHDVDGLDSAPYRLWLEAHKGLRVREVCYWPENLYLRKCGYVMWDIGMTGKEDPDFDEEMRQWIKDGQRQALIETIERQRGRNQMRRSWEERAAIYKKGGRGFLFPSGLYVIPWE